MDPELTMRQNAKLMSYKMTYKNKKSFFIKFMTHWYDSLNNNYDDIYYCDNRLKIQTYKSAPGLAQALL